MEAITTIDIPTGMRISEFNPRVITLRPIPEDEYPVMYGYIYDGETPEEIYRNLNEFRKFWNLVDSWKEDGSDIQLKWIITPNLKVALTYRNNKFSFGCKRTADRFLESHMGYLEKVEDLI